MYNKIRILFTIPNFITAGSGREMFNIIERLDKNIFEPFIAVRTNGGLLYDEIIAKGYTVIIHSFSAEGNQVSNRVVTIKDCVRFFKRYRFDIWQSFNWTSDYTEAIIAKLSGAKYVYVKKNMNWNRKAWKIKSLFSNAIIARNTTLMRSVFKSPLYKNKAVYIHGGVDSQKFQLGRSDFRERYKIPFDTALIACTAQLVRVKDQATLLKSIADIDNLRIVLAGNFVDTIYVEELKQLIAELKIGERVIMNGAITDINNLLSASDIFVLPTSKLHSHEEGCPVALLEAMVCEVPCIASNVAGNNDLIIHNETGLLFAPGNEKELKACIDVYLTDVTCANRMAKAAGDKIRNNYTLDIEAEAFENVYKKLCNHW